MSLADIRKSYTLGGLRRADLAPNPVVQFDRWMRDALQAGLPEPTAMTLATVDRTGLPSARIVLLKGVSDRGFLFFTNYESRKARDLEHQAAAALAFFWPELERQVRVEGRVTRCHAEESDHYFRSRPRGHRLAAWVSRQSEPVSSRAELEAKLAELERRHPGEDIPRPAHWGGYQLAPTHLEFWQGRPNRLHDRFAYTLLDTGEWRVERLAP